MKINPDIWTWIGQLISTSVTGFFHGGAIGGPAGVVSGTSDLKQLARDAAIGGLIGIGKDLTLFVNANPMPNLLAPAAKLQPNSANTPS